MKTNRLQPTTGKQTLLRTSLLILLVLLCALPTWAVKKEHIKKQEINKSFDANKNDLLQVDNRFGNITIAAWNKKQVEINIKIEVSANNEKRTQEILDRIHIEMNKKDQVISAITNIDPDNGSSGKQSFSINYFINMPAEMACHLTQKYGNINMPENNKGKCDLHAKYGNINGGNFSASLNAEVKYGNMTINNTTAELTIDCKYGNLTLGKVKEMNAEVKYGNLQIEEVENGNVEQKYGNGTIQRVKESIIFEELGYGTLNINELDPHFKKVYADARYSTLNINIKENASFRVLAEDLKYGSCQIKGFKVTHRNQKEEPLGFDSKTQSKGDSYDLNVNEGKNGLIHFEGNRHSNIKVTTLK